MSIELLVYNINNILVKINGSDDIYSAVFKKYGHGNNYAYDVLHNRTADETSLGWIIEINDNMIVSGINSVKLDKTAFNDFYTYKNRVHILNNKYFDAIKEVIYKYFGSDIDAVVLKSDKYFSVSNGTRPNNENEDTYSIEKTQVDNKNYVIIHCLGVLKYREASDNVSKYTKNIKVGFC